jgi:type IV secretory pathway VirB6-like protein
LLFVWPSACHEELRKLIHKEDFAAMKKLITLLFTAALVFSLTMPAFAQETTGKEAAPAVEKKEAAPAVEKKEAAPAVEMKAETKAKKAEKKAKKEAKKEAKEAAKEETKK